ncbi:hypothetical protein DY000_02052283 [Brassica cretica]|uniref:Uncharacterized protein n=1 Tax=Brassica cretica TaxID=69181 RepID=A0ABQ7AHY1_BRACR|nr:hypothetical protein DY000_02052283 [Brassica cretica]
MQFSSDIEVLDDHQYVEASQRGLRFRDEVDKSPVEVALIDTDQIPSNDTNKPASIDATTSPSIDIGRVLEQKEFDVCGNLRDGYTRDQTSMGEIRGGIGRREKGSRTVLRQRRRLYGGDFHTRMIKLQRADIETCFGACSHSHPESTKIVNSNDGTVAAPSDTVAKKIERHCARKWSDTLARKSSNTVAKTSTDTVEENQELL